MKNDERQFNPIINLSFFISIISTLLLFIILFFIDINYELIAIDIDLKIAVILILYFATELLLLYLCSILLGLNFYRLYSQIFRINSIIHIVFLLVLLFISTINIENALAVLLAKNLITLFFVIIKIRSRLNFKINFEYNLYSKMVKSGFIYSIALLLLSLIYNTDILILKHFAIDANDFGVYALTSKIVHGICIMPQSIGTIFFSLSLNKNYSSSISSKIIIIKIFFYFLAFFLIVLYLLLPELIQLFLGSAYNKIFDIFLLLIPGICGLFLIKTLYPDLAGQGQVKPFIYIFFYISIFQLILNFLLIPRYSIYGCAIACSISYLALATLIIIKYLKINKLKFSQLVVLTINDIKSINYT